MHDNDTYTVWELDGIPLRILVAGKKIKVFWRRNGRFCAEDLEALEHDQQTDDEGAYQDEAHDKMDKEWSFTHAG